MAERTPLSTLLSQLLVAFTIEYDNEFEQRLSKTWARPFGTSMVMWSNFMRFVVEEGVAVGDLVARSSLSIGAVSSIVGGMERWGYIAVDHDPADGIAAPRKGFGTARGVKEGTVIRPSMTGKVARDLWRPLAGEIELRWRERLGEQPVDDLREALGVVQGEIGTAMPHFLPVVGGRGLFAGPAVDIGPGEDGDDHELPALLSRVLLAFTLDLERESDVSVALGANVLRVLPTEPLPVKALPIAAGVSKEAVAVSLTWLQGAGYVTVGSDPSARGKVATLTSQGREARAEFAGQRAGVERRWEARQGEGAIRSLRSSAQAILDQRGGEDGPLSAGLVPPPGGWRGAGRYKPLTAAFIESPKDNLPHHPMVLHRGGWPDGS